MAKWIRDLTSRGFMAPGTATLRSAVIGEQMRQWSWRRLLMHYGHGLFWVALLVVVVAVVARRYSAFRLGPLAEILLLAICLAIPVLLAIRALQRETSRSSDQHAIEHLLGSLIGEILDLLFDLAIVATVMCAYFSLVFLVWAAIKSLCAQL